MSRVLAATPSITPPILEIRDLKNYLGGRWVHNGINLKIPYGEIIAIIGSSGCGKTTLLRSMLMLQQPTSGSVKLFSIDITHCNYQQALAVKQRTGVLFQMNALFSSLTVLENVMFPLQQHTKLTGDELHEIALLKIMLSGLEPEAASQYPAELSGGMKKRAAMARAIALDPELLFLDEPTAGLDPNSAAALDELVLDLRVSLGLTFIIVTHDLDTLWRVPDRVVFLGEGKVLAASPMNELVKNPHPLIQNYFGGYRGRLVRYGNEA